MAEYSVLCEYVEKIKAQGPGAHHVTLEVRDIGTWERKVVKALVARSVDDLADGEKLFIEDYGGNLQTAPWAIKVVEELDSDEFVATPEAYFRMGW
ncbi:MAG: hypothetical protein HY675_13300 [Chloroflexi bacterium]|nr:hypothetical protein [Chloroflexota bacterium]